jgi:hypothetical protein
MRGHGFMNFQCSLTTLAALVLSACASDPPAQAPVTEVTPPPAAAVVEKPAPPQKVVNVEKSSPPPKIVKARGPKAPSQCQGLPQLACINVEGCEWIKHPSTTDKDGRPLMDYCELKATTASVRE